MCCNEEHYPKNAGIFRTDHAGVHQHYAAVVTAPRFIEDEVVRDHVFEADEKPPSCYGPEEDHWHAILPVRLTICIDNNLNTAFTLRAHDWFRWEREATMGLPRQRVFYSHGQWAFGDYGHGYDFLATFKVPDQISKDERDRVREKVLIAVAEGMDLSVEAFKALLQDELKHGLNIIYRETRPVTRGEYPDLETWLRGNPFTKPPLNGNELLYGSDMGSYIMRDEGAGSWGTGSWADLDPAQALAYEAAPPPERGLQRGIGGIAYNVEVVKKPTQPPPPARPRRYRPPPAQGDLL